MRVQMCVRTCLYKVLFASVRRSDDSCDVQGLSTSRSTLRLVRPDF
jgi:hypothetical protein